MGTLTRRDGINARAVRPAGPPRRRGPSWRAAGLLGMALAAGALAGGCAGPPPAGPAPPAEAGRIVDFLTLETGATLTVVVRGSRPLAYTALKQDAPPRVLLQFPATGLQGLAEVYRPPENDVVAAIRASRPGDTGGETRITIDLKRDLGYTVEPEGNDLHIVFEKPGPSRPAPAAAAGAAKARASRTQPARARPGPAAVVTELLVATGPEGVSIRVAANGPVDDFVSFTLEDPARCVVDLNGVGSTAKGVQARRVDSPFAREVRYFAHPDKVRVVVETAPAHLGTCRATGAEGGLVLTVGRRPPPPAQALPPRSATTGE